jgi:septal ring factor EnvC (AmiA/AmiB activator)
MKKICIIVIVALSFSVMADNYEEIEKLKEEIHKVDLEMHKTRVKLIKTDSSLKAIEEKIIELHKELAIRIDNKTEMRELIDKKKKLKTKIEVLEDEN